MSRSRYTEFRVGLFVAVGLLLTMVMVFMLGSDRRFFTRYYTLYANFGNISGLRVGAPVQLAGLSVGTVEDVRLPDEMGIKLISVVLKIDKGYEGRIRADSIATVETQGLLGDKFIQITVGSEGQDMLPDKGIISSKDTASIFALAEKAGEIMKDMGEASKTFNELLSVLLGDTKNKDAKSIVTIFRKNLEQVEKGQGLIHALIYDANGGRAVTDFSAAMASLKSLLGGVEADKNNGVGTMLGDMRVASSDLKVILSSIRKGEGSLGMFIRDPALYEDLRTFLGRANRSTILRSVVRSTLEKKEAAAIEAQPKEK